MAKKENLMNNSEQESVLSSKITFDLRHIYNSADDYDYTLVINPEGQYLGDLTERDLKRDALLYDKWEKSKANYWATYFCEEGVKNTKLEGAESFAKRLKEKLSTYYNHDGGQEYSETKCVDEYDIDQLLEEMK